MCVKPFAILAFLLVPAGCVPVARLTPPILLLDREGAFIYDKLLEEQTEESCL